MIHTKEDGKELVSDLYEDYANCSWKVGSRAISIVSAAGNQEVEINWEDVPALVSDLLLLYEEARQYMIGITHTERSKPNLG